mmetsp:Transcript_147157/g.367008  ORF Transcript_147157/g.367008 Transcript_147157/m.367008 type:complete len:241 (-) Transcript_147157:133-855(-)
MSGVQADVESNMHNECIAGLLDNETHSARPLVPGIPLDTVRTSQKFTLMHESPSPCVRRRITFGGMLIIGAAALVAICVAVLPARSLILHVGSTPESPDRPQGWGSEKSSKNAAVQMWELLSPGPGDCNLADGQEVSVQAPDGTWFKAQVVTYLGEGMYEMRHNVLGSTNYTTQTVSSRRVETCETSCPIQVPVLVFVALCLLGVLCYCFGTTAKQAAAPPPTPAPAKASEEFRCCAGSK